MRSFIVGKWMAKSCYGDVVSIDFFHKIVFIDEWIEKATTRFREQLFERVTADGRRFEARLV